MKHLIRSIVLWALLALGACPALAATVSVATPDAFYAAARASHPGDVVSVSAFSGTMDLSNMVSAAPGFTIQPAAGVKIKLDRIVANGTQGVTVRGFDVAVTPSWMSGIYAINCARLTFDGLHVYSADGTLSNTGAMFRNCTDGVISNGEFDHLGVGASLLDSLRIAVRGNKAHDINTDGVDVAGSSFVTVDANSFTDFFPAVGAHPDAIQFWATAANPLPGSNTVTNNTYVRGKGTVAQGIFIESQKGMTITGNGLLGTMYNAISVSTTQGAAITGNFVQSYADMGTRIIARGGSDSITVSGNSVSDPIINLVQAGEAPVTNFVLGANTTIKTAAIGDTSALDAWLAAKAAPVVTPPVVTPPDPRDAQIATLTAANVSLTASVATLTQAASVSAAQLSAAQTAAATAQAAAQAAATQLAAVNVQLTASKAQVTALTTQLTASQSALTAANAATAQAQASLKTATDSVTALSKKIANAQAALK